MTCHIRYTPEAINNFCEIIGVTRSRNFQSYGLLEECCRKDLENRVNREMAVIRPLRVTLTNYPADKVETRTVLLFKHQQLLLFFHNNRIWFTKYAATI